MIHNRVKEVKKRKSLAALLVTAALMITSLLPASVFAVEDNSPSLKPYENDLLYERTFDSGLCYPWHTCEDTGGECDFEVVDVGGSKAMSVTVKNPGQNKWSVQLRHRMITMESGHNYKIHFKMWAKKSCKAYIKIGMQGDPYTDYFSNNWVPIEVGTSPKEYDFDYTHNAATDSTCEFAFHIGSGMSDADNVYYLDDASIYDPNFKKPVVNVLEMPDIRVNQVGYFPNGEKTATLLSTSTSPLTWKLLKNGSEVATGTTVVVGLDKDSQDSVHKIDFSSYKTEGTNYTLAVGNSTSHPFDISASIYSDMKDDAIKYFYHNRSGIAIEMPYAGRQDLTRKAGHIGVSPNQGDKSVSTWPGTGQSNYSLDVSGGWYDAGDHGKYVVNGGIALWTMLNQYERESIVPDGDLTKAPYADGTMNIPESGNGVPDILDEAKWEMDWMMKMQVPENKDSSIAGMVHHKIHDESWTALGLRPSDDPKVRYLRPVSTAATLNLAATAAQASRIWKGLGDTSYANTCLTAAEKAWNAALKHPDIYAPLDNENGGGPYNDNNVTDEFYWAACELYITTGKDTYKDYLKTSNHYLEMPSVLGEGEDDGLTGCFTWGNTQGLGTVSLALVENGLGSSEIAKARANIAAACDDWLKNIDKQGYSLPIMADRKGDYPWGSNSFIINIAIVFGYAFDYTGNTKYLDGMKKCMDYLLGNNALDQSYVTGYGERPTVNPHHRFWAHQLSSEFPLAPAGILAGGPNSNFEDPTINAAVTKDTPPQKCYIDNLDAWSVNEITINWNAPFAWVTAYLDRNGNKTGGTGVDPTDTPKDYKLGDVDLNGSEPNAIDFATMRKALLGQIELSDKAIKAADLDKNGQFNAIDFGYMRKYLLGMITDLETLK